MQPNPPTSLAQRLSHPNRNVLLAFAIYGMVAGIMLEIDGERYEQDIFNAIALAMNYPTIVALLMIYGENFLIPVPIPIWDTITVLISIAVWTLIGYIVYCFYRIFTSKAIE